MRLLFAALANLIRAFFFALSIPTRLLARRRRPEYVRFRLEGEPLYRKSRRRPFQLWRRRPEPDAVTSLEALHEELGLLAKDPRVKGALFEVEGLTVSPAKRLALAEEISAFRAAGKEAVGFAVTASTPEYELLCAANRILVPPAGRIDLTGFSAEAIAAGAALRRFGIHADFVRRGEHKTAPEMFTHDAISPAVRTTLERLLDERHQELLAAVSRGRKISAAEAAARVDEGPYSAKRALAKGLVDALCSEADLPDLLCGGPQKPEAPPARPEPVEGPAEALAWKISGFDSYARTLLRPRKGWRPLRARQKLGLVKLEGMIVQGEGASGFGPRLVGDKPAAKALRAAAREGRTEAVLLYVDSPGGSAVASELILEEVRRLARKKPVLAYFDRVAASGGYMAALGAREIWAGPLSIAGSVGVFAGKFDIAALLDRLGVRTEILTRGRNAGLQAASRPFTEAERAALEAEVEEMYQAFLEAVAASRNMSREEAHQRGEGRVYSGAAAVEARLADRVGSFDAACRRALELAGAHPKSFDLLGHSTAPWRPPFLSAFQQLGRAQDYALWSPWVRLDDLGRP